MLISVLFCIDGNYWQHLAAAIASLISSNPRNQFRVFVVSASEMDQKNLDRIRSMMPPDRGTIEPIIFDDAGSYQHLRTHSHITFATYLRLFLTEYLPADVQKVLYLDSDVIVAADIGELWSYDLGTAYLGASPEPYDVRHRAELGFGPGDLYINAGVMLVNVAQWRADSVLPKLIDFASNSEKKLPSLDQDILNSVLRGNIRNVGYQWNWQALFPRFTPGELGLTAAQYQQERLHPRIVHYTSHYKPWYDRWQPHYKELYYDALSRTPWAQYVPPDRSLRKLPVKLAKTLQRKLEWHLPSLARKLRDLRGSGGKVE